MSPSQPQHLALHQLYSGSAGPVFGGSMYNGFPVFNPMLQASLGGPGHESIPSLSLGHPASSPGFLSPMTYMIETDTEAMLKKIHQERQALMVRHHLIFTPGHVLCADVADIITIYIILW